MRMSQTVERCEMVESCQHRYLPTQGCHHRLVTFLLLWVSVLTIGQVLSITLYLTFGAHVRESTTKPQQDWNILESTQRTPPEAGVTSGKILIYAFAGLQSSASPGGDRLQWRLQNEQSAPFPVSVDNGRMTVREDGSYFLYVQVGLGELTQREHTVRVQHADQADQAAVILESRVSNLTLTTGFLGKAVLLSANDQLEVTVYPKGPKVNSTNCVTYMGIYQFPQPIITSTQS